MQTFSTARIAAVGLLSLLAAVPTLAHAATVSDIDGSIFGHTQDGYDGDNYEQVGVDLGPPSTVTSKDGPTAGPIATAKTTATLSHTLMAVDFCLSHPGAPNAFAQSFGTIDFTITPDVVGAPLFYDISGALDYDRADGHFAYLLTSLKDLDTNQVLYSSYFDSYLTASSTLGLQSDATHPIHGPLVAGHTYRWFFDGAVSDDSTDPILAHHTVGTGTGGLTLSLSEGPVPGVGTVPTPLPAAVWGGALLLTGVGMVRRRRA